MKAEVKGSYKKGHYKMFHKGFTKKKGRGMTEGDITEKIGSIRDRIFKWDDKKAPIRVRALKEILGSCGFYMTEDNIRRMAQEGSLHGIKENNYIWNFPKNDLFKWTRYLEKIGMRLLIERGIIKEERTVEDTSALVGREKGI